VRKVLIGVVLIVGLGVAFWPKTRRKKTAVIPMTNAAAAVPSTAPGDERFFKEVWPIAKTNFFDKLESVGVVNPLGTSIPKVGSTRFGGDVCLARLNDKFTVGYYNIERENLRLQGISTFVESGSDENGVPNDSDAVLNRLHNPRTPQLVKDELIAKLNDTNLYPRLEMERAMTLANEVLRAVGERPDLYKLKTKRHAQIAEGYLPNYIFIYDRIDQKQNFDPSNVAQKDDIFIVLRSSRDGVHLQQYSSAYWAFELEAATKRQP
jgi:hypothetical protein